MAVTLYTNGRLLLQDGVLENGQIAVEHAQVQFTVPGEGEKPKKVKPSSGDKITYVGTSYDGTPDEVVDLAGCTVIPGFICADARLDTLAPCADDFTDNIGTAYRTYMSLRACGEALNTGVTTVKAVGMPNNIDIGLKNAFAKTMFFGPAVLATGPIFGATAGKGHEKYGLIECSGEDDFRAQVRIHISRGLEGVTFQVSGDRMKSLKGEFCAQMIPSELNAMVKHVRGAEKPVAVNASGDPSVRMALDAGADIIQQGYRISRPLLEEMAEKGVYYVPCLVSTLGTDLEAEHQETVRNAIEAGVRVIAGTEILPGQPVDGTTAMIKELELLVKCGMPPAAALNAAGAAAAACCRAKAGTIKAGAVPDLVIVDGKPDEDIAALRNMAGVVRAGRPVFAKFGGKNERYFSQDAAAESLSLGNTVDWTKDAIKGVKEPDNLNTVWNLIKEI